MAPLSFLLLEEGVAGPAELESLGRGSVFILHKAQMRLWPLWWTGSAQYTQQLGDGPVLSRSAQPSAVWRRNGGVGRGAGTRDLGGLGRRAPLQLSKAATRLETALANKGAFSSTGEVRV